MTKRVVKQAAVIVLLVGALAGCKPGSLSTSAHSVTGLGSGQAAQEHSVSKRAKPVHVKSSQSTRCVRRVLQRPIGNC
jgi:hypothetical protein